MCAHTFMILCVCVSFCVSVYVNCRQACTSRCEEWACVNQVFRSWIFRNFSFYVLMPMQFCNNFLLLVIHSSMQYALWSLWRTYPSGLQVSFPIPQVLHLRNIIYISSEFQWPVQDSCRSDCITNCVFTMPNIPILTYCTQRCLLTPSSSKIYILFSVSCQHMT